MIENKPGKQLNRTQLLEQVENLIEEKHFEKLKDVLAEARSSDVAEVVEVLDELARQILFDLLDPKLAGEVLEKIDDATRSELVEELTGDELTDMVETLPPDEAADIVADLSEEQTQQVLDHIDQEDSHQIKQLLKYAEDTAGGIMNPELVKADESACVEDAMAKIRRADPDEEFFYVFVVDKKGLLKGTIGWRKLLRAVPNQNVTEIMDNQLPAVHVNADQEEIANIFRKNDLLVMPVIDDDGVLLGRITVDDVIDVMEEEAEEDALVMAGTHPAELDTPKLFKAATVRLPWLLTCMFGAMLSTVLLISVFESQFSKAEWISIFMFLPAIAAIGGNSGLQTSTIVVRGLATGDLAALNILQVFLREIRVGLIVAATCGLLAGVAAAIWLFIRPGELQTSQAAMIGISVGIAMFCGIMLSTSIGLLLPFLFRKIGIDPAISSGPIVTTANDTLGYLCYFSLALFLLHMGR